MLCEPLGVHVNPAGSVSVPETLVASDPETATVTVKVSPRVTLDGRLTLVMDIEPVAATKADSITMPIKTASAVLALFIPYQLTLNIVVAMPDDVLVSNLTW